MAIPTTSNESTTAKKTRPISFGALRDKAFRRFSINKPIRVNETITKSSRNIVRPLISNFTAARTTSYAYTTGKKTAGITKSAIRFNLVTIYYFVFPEINCINKTSIYLDDTSNDVWTIFILWFIRQKMVLNYLYLIR
jgi:hypothetical protein